MTTQAMSAGGVAEASSAAARAEGEPVSVASYRVAGLLLSFCRRVPGLPSFVVFLVYALFDAALAKDWLREALVSIPADEALADGWLIMLVLDGVFRRLTSAPGLLLEWGVNWPAPRDLTSTDHFLAWQVLYAPLRWLSGSAFLAFNLTLFLAQPLAGLFGYRLLRRSGVDRWISWLGGAFGSAITFLPTMTVRPHVLQLAPAALLGAFLALRCLRDEPRLRRAAALALAVAFGSLTSFYGALAIAIGGLSWFGVELVRPVPRRSGFFWWVAGAVAVASLPVVGLGIYYLEAGARATAAQGLLFNQWATRNLGDKALASEWELAGLLQNGDAWRWLVGGFPDSLPFLVGFLGLFALRRASPEWRLARAGLLLIVVGAVFSCAAWFHLGEAWWLPTPALVFYATPLRFARRYFVLQMIKGLGGVLLVTAGYAAVVRRVGRWASPLLVVLVVGADLLLPRLLRCDPLSGWCEVHEPELQLVRRAPGDGLKAVLPLRGESPSPGFWIGSLEPAPSSLGMLRGYFHPRLIGPDERHFRFGEWFGEKLAAEPGPVLDLPAAGPAEYEVPLWRFREPAPRLLGWTGYYAPHVAWVYDRIKAGEITTGGLRDLVEATGLRWLVVHPEEDWGANRRRERSALVEHLRTEPFVEQLLHFEGFVVVRFDSRHRRSTWFEALRLGYQPGRTILGTPLAPISAAPDAIDLRFASLAKGGVARWVFPTRLRIKSTISLPAAHPYRAQEPMSVHLRLRWVGLDTASRSVAEPPATVIELKRDIAEGEIYDRAVRLKTPRVAGSYRLVGELVQSDGRILAKTPANEMRIDEPGQRGGPEAARDPRES